MARSEATGPRFERIALTYLRLRGLRLVERNFRCRGGEIDLIMRHDACLVFVEVRFRASSRFGSAAASVHAHKQARLIHAAQVFLSRSSQALGTDCRFDVLAFEGSIRPVWIRNAFDASSE